MYDDNVVPQQDEYLAPTEQELKQAKTNAKVGSTSTSQTEVRHCDLTTWCSLSIIIIIMYLCSAQYLHILQDSKRYLTNPTV